MKDYAHSTLSVWIRAARLTVDGALRRPQERITYGERVAVPAWFDHQVEVIPPATDWDLVCEHEAIRVANKPAGLVGHPGAGHRDGTLQNARLHHCAARVAPRDAAGGVHGG